VNSRAEANRQRAAVPHPRLGADYGVHAGAILADELAQRGMSQAELATRTGLSPKHINQVIKGIAPMTTDTALLVERTLGISAPMLAGVESSYQATRGRLAARDRLAALADWFHEFPVPSLVARGVIDPRAALIEQIEALLAFFGVADEIAFDRLYDDAALSFRRAQKFEVDPKATATWLRLAEVAAEQIARQPYDRAHFKALLSDLPSLTREPIATAFPKLQARCAAVGVGVVFEDELPQSRACAATRWPATDRPVIALTARGRYEDGLWFSFFHEAAHVVLHPRRRSVVHLEPRGDDGDGAETEANDFASGVLLRGHAATVHLQVHSATDAIRVAEALNVDPGIVGGQAAFAQREWARYAKVRRKIEGMPPAQL